MLDKIKQEMMQQGMKLMTNPKVMKMISDPRVMNALSQGFALKGRIQSELEHKLRQMALSLNLATREDVETLRQNLNQMEAAMTDLERRVGE